jgi:hypothetical protein
VTPRLIDVLCGRHADRAQQRWPVPGDLFALFDKCGTCNFIAYNRTGGTVAIRSLPDLDHRTYEYATCLHEASHAVIGLAARIPVNFVVVVPRTGELQTEPGGQTNVGEFSVPFDQWAAMMWAGQRAQMRWLRSAGWDTPANRVDVANLGWDDTRRVLDDAAKHGLPDDVGWELCGELLDLRWPAVERVADALLTAGRLSGDEVAAIAGLPCREPA